MSDVLVGSEKKKKKKNHIRRCSLAAFTKVLHQFTILYGRNVVKFLTNFLQISLQIGARNIVGSNSLSDGRLFDHTKLNGLYDHTEISFLRFVFFLDGVDMAKIASQRGLWEPP